MLFEVNGKQVYASTGGRNHVQERPWIIFVHGAGQTHLTWSQQSRALAYDDNNILAPDLPGHGKSDGPALRTIEEMASWYVDVMDALKIEKAHFVNHSMGGLICLEIAAKQGERVHSVTFIATALSIAVNDALIEMAKTKPMKAIAFMTDYSSSAYSYAHDNSVPGASIIGTGLQIMQMNEADALPNDLQACASYDQGAEQAKKVTCATLCLLSGKDRMVQTRFGLKLADALQNNRTHIFEDAGHSLTVECPREINARLRAFLAGI